MAKYHVGEKDYWKGMKNGGEMLFFRQMIKSMHIFSPIYLKLKKDWKYSACGAHPLLITNFIWGKNINQEGGRGKMNLKFNIHPWLVVYPHI